MTTAFRAILFLFCFFNFTRHCLANLISRDVGRVGSHIVTSREVIANSIIEDQYFRGGKTKNIATVKVKDRLFIQEVTAVLIERAISLESQEFPVAHITTKEISDQKNKMSKTLSGILSWQNLQLSESELTELISTKLAAKKFVQFKVESASLPISDAEVQAYFEKNKFKFENLSFDQFKANIKSFLVKKQVDDRLREWFEVLKIKYSIRNHLAEGKGL